MQSRNHHQQLIKEIPENFQFSQGSLQAYSNCPRLFQLRYVQRLSWPAPKVESAMENEHYMHLGSVFHRLVQQYYIGIPTERLSQIALQETILSQWWKSFLKNAPNLSGYTQHKELSLSTNIGGHRLIGKFDLIAISIKEENDTKKKVVIYDWKTSRNNQPPKPQWLEKKLQTRAYPYLVVNAGAHLNDGIKICPDQIEMIYWFSSSPKKPIKFTYSQDKFESDDGFITNLISEIKSMGNEEAPKTENLKQCQFCVYRSLCNRGVSAGSYDDLEVNFDEDEEIIKMDFEQIAEIEF